MSDNSLQLDCDMGEVTFTFLENGELQIELFAQHLIVDKISKDQTDQLAKWLVFQMI